MRRRTLFAMIRAMRHRHALAKYACEFDQDSNTQSTEILSRLNAVWKHATQTTPYWRQFKADTRLPDRFASTDEFVASVPVVTRATLKEHCAAMTSTSAPPDYYRVTGGSTAQPVRIPSWSSEISGTHCDAWIGRKWYGIDDASPLFTIWGHAHLLGHGWKGRLRGWQRRTKDRMLGYCRFSAYDLRSEQLRKAAHKLIQFRPAYVVGYSVALDLFARANLELRGELRQVGVKVVIGTAESFPSPDSGDLLADLFGCPVAMEYGANETGIIAHTRPDGGYRVLWRSHFVDVEPRGTGHVLRVTSLYHRCLPLLRYELGDEIELNDPDEQTTGVLSFRRVLGRCHDYVEFPDGARLHSALFTAAIRQYSHVLGYQIVQERNNIEFRYLANADLTGEESRHIVERLTRVHPGLATTSVQRVEALERTVAGKTRLIIRR